jgi:hypothetical protein
MYKTNRTYITKEQTPYRVQTGFRLYRWAGQFYSSGSLQAMLAALIWSYELIEQDTM